MADFLTPLLLETIRPVHDGLQAEFGIPATIDADCLSLAIKVQESGPGPTRDQGDPAVTGPATGLWQFEKTGGVWEVLNLASISPIFRELCSRAGVMAEADPVWRFFTTPQSDQLAAAAARLVIYTDPAPLPAAAAASANAALAYYLRRWRPAKSAKREQDFLAIAWPTALRVIQANPRGATAPVGIVSPAPPPTPPHATALPPDALAGLDARVSRIERSLKAAEAVWRG